MRHYTVSIFACGTNERGSSYSNQNNIWIFDAKERTKGFKNIRKFIKESYKYFLKKNTPCANEIMYYGAYSCYDSISKKKSTCTFKIDPKELSR